MSERLGPLQKEQWTQHRRGMKILIVDRHEVIHYGLKRMLQSEFPESEFGEAFHYQQCLDLVRRKSWNVVILGIWLPGHGGIELMKEIRAEYPNLPVIVLSICQAQQYAVRAFKAGASGYLSMECPSDQLVSAIEEVLRGGKYANLKTTEYLIDAVAQGSQRAPHEILSDREYEVMRLIITGKNTSAIARQLSLSIKTVSTYRARILGKLQLESFFELILYAIDHGLINI